jgi:adenylate cyclase
MDVWRPGLKAGLGAFLCVLILQFAGLIQGLENSAQDALRRAQALPYQTPIEVVYLDDVSLNQARDQYQLSYPWPRETYANAIDFLRQAGARAVVFDFLFTDASSNGPADDQLFAQAIQRQGKVFAGMQFTADDQPGARALFFKQTPFYQLTGVDAATLHQAHGIDAPKPPLWGAFAGVGDTSFEQDADGEGRRSRLAVALDGRVYPSLALATVLGLGMPLPDLAKESRPLVLFRKPKGIRDSTRLYDIVQSWNNLKEGKRLLVDPARFNGKVVVIGSSAPGLNDLRPTPMARNLPGVELQAMLIDNLLNGDRLTELPMGFAYGLLLLILCLAVANLCSRFRGGMIFLPFILALGLSFGIAVWAYQERHLLLPLALPGVASLLALIFSAVSNFLAERNQRQWITNAFGQFLSPVVVARLREHGDKLVTGGETRPMTVYFSDLQGFTSFSEQLTPERLVEILNLYLTEMAEVIVGGHDGTVDKYIGDAIMAFWNAPIEQPDHAFRACAAAWDCQLKLAEIQKRLADLGLDAGDEGLVMRIGLNTGPGVAGLMGSPRKLNYTVMGDTVNTASRLEGANKPYGSRILMSLATKDAAGPRVLTRPLDYVKVKGKKEATPLFEMIGLEGVGKPLYNAEYVDAWVVALADYKRGDFAQAISSFEACQQKQPQDKAAQLFIDRSRHFLDEHPAAWDGVYEMKTK